MAFLVMGRTHPLREDSLHHLRHWCTAAVHPGKVGGAGAGVGGCTYTEHPAYLLLKFPLQITKYISVPVTNTCFSDPKTF